MKAVTWISCALAALLPIGAPAQPLEQNCAPDCNVHCYTRSLVPDCPDGQTNQCMAPNGTVAVCCNHRHLAESYVEAVVQDHNTCVRNKEHKQSKRRHTIEVCDLDANGNPTGVCKTVAGPFACDDHYYYTDVCERCTPIQ